MNDGPSRRVIIPATVTLAGAACGFTAIVALIGASDDPAARLPTAAWLIVAAWVTDMLDGPIARLVGATSAFGAELDSLCDAISFGVAPAVVLVAAGGATPVAIGVALAYLVAVVVRLARFNAFDAGTEVDHLYFRGLASPAAAMVVATWVLCRVRLAGGAGLAAGPASETSAAAAGVIGATLPFAALVLAVLMVTRRRYPDLPKHYLRRRLPLWHLVVVAGLAAVTAPELVLAIVFTLYAIVGGRRAGRAPAATTTR